ncbi:MAG: geopeptide radical SAM maturase [Deltaproteobacteria bacterium]|nr:geopeptide radical SAM maturase [Deltaproteobacteria bacterium]
MLLSPYCIVRRHQSIPGQVLLFTAKTGALVLLPEADFLALQKGNPVPEQVEALIDMGFLVGDVKAERREVLGYLDDINRLNPNLTVAIVLGMECNFACRYCFEGEQKGRKSMDDATADQLVSFIKRCFTPDKKKLALQFYGGEPLLYTKRIVYLAKHLKPFVEERGAQLTIDLVSNGSLLTAKVVEELNPWGLDGVKVTIDGPPDNHNHYRPFKSGEKSFDIIVKNLKEVCGKTKIRLGGNFNEENYREFASVLDLLAQEGIGPDQVERVIFNIIVQVRDELTGNRYRGGCATVNEPWLREAALHVRAEVFRRGYVIPEIGPQPCGVEIDDAFTVHYDGSLYKCVTWVGHEQFKIGDVWQGVDESYHQTHHVGHWQREEKCRQCVYLPLCFGGCRFMAYQRDGHMGRVDCQLEFFDAALGDMLLQEATSR